MFRYFGPPGTGKTTTLINQVEKALGAGVLPNQIGFFSFTRKAAEEARDRAAKKFNLDSKELPFFRTLHSFSLAMSDIRAEQVMQKEHYRELSEIMGFNLSVEKRVSFDEDVPSIVKSNDPVLGVINLARLRKIDLREQYNQTELEQSWNTVNYVAKSLLEYKKQNEVFDFTDMLEQFVIGAEHYCPRFALTFMDEAQDLSALQWDIAHALDAKSERMYCAGDDDQAIYRWAGADVDQFINLDGGSETLSQSYRIPKSVHFLAQKIASRIHRRFPKSYKAKDFMGTVQNIYAVNELDMSKGTWLILAQAGYMLAPVATELKTDGYLFDYRGSRSISERLSEAVNGWEQLRKGRQVTGAVARTIYSYMTSKERILRGHKKLTTLGDEDLVTLDQLIADHGLMPQKDLLTPIQDCIWHEAMDNIPSTERAYITALLRRGEKFNAEPRIKVSTIHGSKGGEADNVVLFTDLSTASEEEFRKNPDDTHRVFYVGVTRAKENLYLVEPQDLAKSYDLI